METYSDKIIIKTSKNFIFYLPRGIFDPLLSSTRKMMLPQVQFTYFAYFILTLPYGQKMCENSDVIEMLLHHDRPLEKNIDVITDGY